jgi:tetratricopeptide (TPR) repeat protein
MRGRAFRRVGFARAAGLVLVALAAAGSIAAHADDVARGDAAWSDRAAGERDGRPPPDRVLEAIRSYEAALASRPESLEARWKLLRALHFAGDFVLEDREERRRIFDRGRQVSEQGLELLARRVGSGRRLDELETEELERRLHAADVSPNDVARLYFWSAVNWGAWSRVVGLLGAVRQGVATRLHRYTQITIALEPEYEEGGAFRLLGRLHAELPRVPFLSGWVDRGEAIPLTERAYAIAPANPGNRLLLALTLLDLAPERRPEALELLRQVEGFTPRPSMQIEDLYARREARKKLSEEEAALSKLRVEGEGAL